MDNVTFEELNTLKDNDNTIIIDVREPEELQEFGVIPNSINIPLGDVENILKNLSPSNFLEKYNRNKPTENFPIIFTCRSGRRSGIAQEVAIKLGFKNVRNYGGGWLEWEERFK